MVALLLCVSCCIVYCKNKTEKAYDYKLSRAHIKEQQLESESMELQ